VLLRPATCDDPARAVPSHHAGETREGNELVIKVRVFQFGSPKTRRLGIVIAGMAIIFLILVLMFGRG